MFVPSPFRPRVVAILTALSLVASASVAGVVSAAADKEYSATVAPEPLVAGAWYGEGARAASPLILTITNESNQANLGSVNVSVPAGITVTAAAPAAGFTASFIALRDLDLAPAESATILIDAQIECAANHTAYVWTFQVKQANDFNGTPGNDLDQVGTTTNTIAGECGIAFSGEPEHAQRWTAAEPVAITSKVYDPAGDPVSVTVMDGAGLDVVTWWQGSIALSKGDDPSAVADDETPTATLGGTLSAAAASGVATFAPTLDQSASGYSLNATAIPTAGSASEGTSTTPVESQNFNIVDDATICTTTTAGCEATASNGQKTKATVVADAGGAANDLVILAINPANDPFGTFDCDGYTETSDTVVFDITNEAGDPGSSTRTKSATLTLGAAFVTKSASKYQVCFFDGETASLLSTCTVKNPAPPCIVSKALDKQKNLVIVARFATGDPGLKF